MELILLNGEKLHNIEERIRDYCRVEIYDGYDNYHSVDNYITQNDVNVANSIFAWISKVEAGKIINSKNIQNALRLIENKPGFESFNSRFKNNLYHLYYGFCKIKGIGIAKTTKILHLKRPELIPILDSFVIEYLFNIKTQDIFDKDYLIEMGVIFTEKIWKNINENKEVLENLSLRLSDLPIPLTLIRLYDILIWTTEKWDKRKMFSAPYGSPSSIVITKSDLNIPKQSFFKQEEYVTKGEASVWANIDKPLKKFTMHRDLNCIYIEKKKETPYKGINRLKRDGGWIGFSDEESALLFYKKKFKNKDYINKKHC